MNTFLDKLERASINLAQFFAALVAISIGLAAVLIPLNLLIIKLNIGSMWWLNGSIEYALYFGVFGGATWVLQQGAHVRVDVVTASLSAEAGKQLDFFINIFGAALCVFLCVYGARAGIMEFIDGTIPDKDLRVPNWIVVSFFSFSFAMLAIEFLFRMRTNRVLSTKSDKSSEVGF